MRDGQGAPRHRTPRGRPGGAHRQTAIGRAGLKPAAARAGISENSAARGHGDLRPRPPPTSAARSPRLRPRAHRNGCTCPARTARCSCRPTPSRTPSPSATYSPIGSPRTCRRTGVAAPGPTRAHGGRVVHRTCNERSDQVDRTAPMAPRHRCGTVRRRPPLCAGHRDGAPHAQHMKRFAINSCLTRKLAACLLQAIK